jgi:hypothetical protein
VNGYFDSLLSETTSAQAANTLFSARSGEYFGVLTDDVFQNSPTAAFGAWTELQEAKDNYSYESRILDPEEANSLYGIKGRLKFDSPIREAAAQLMYQRKYGEIYRQQVLGQGTTMQNVSGFGVGMAASLLDPLNVASMFLPVLGEARLAQTLASLGRFAKPAARGILGAAETGVVVGALQGPTALLLNEYQADYDMTTALRDTAFAAAAGGVLRVAMGGFAPKKPEGAIPEVISGTKPETQLQMQAQAAADLAQGKPVNGPQAIIGLDQNVLRAEAENSPEVNANFPDTNIPKDPTKPSGIREAPGFYDPEFKLNDQAASPYLFLRENVVDDAVFNDLMTYGRSLEKVTQDDRLDCHDCIRQLKDYIKTKPQEVQDQFQAFEWNEAKWEEVSKILASKKEFWRENFKNTDVKDLLEDIAMGNINGHSWAKYRGQAVDPYLADLNVPQDEIQKLSDFLEEVYRAAGIFEQKAQEGIAPKVLELITKLDEDVEYGDSDFIDDLETMVLDAGDKFPEGNNILRKIEDYREQVREDIQEWGGLERDGEVLGEELVESMRAWADKYGKVVEVKKEPDLKVKQLEPNIPPGYVKFEKTIPTKLKTENGFKLLYRGDENMELYAPEGAIRFDQALDFLFNSRVIRAGQPYQFKELKDYWSFLVELGVRETDLDRTLLRTGRTEAGRELAGIQTNAAYLKGDLSGFVLTSTVQGDDVLTRTGFDIPGLTAVPIRFKDFTIKSTRGREETIRLGITQRILMAPEYAVLRHFMDVENMTLETALQRIDGMNTVQLDSFINNTPGLPEKARLTVQRALEQITKKAIIANQAFKDLHQKNYGVKIPYTKDAPFEALIIDKGGAVAEGDIKDAAYNILKTIVRHEGLRDPKTGKVIQQGADYANEANRIIEEAILEKLGKGKEDFIREQQLRLAKEKIAKLEQDLANKKDESTWWQPGDEVPIETKAKESISQPRQGIIDDLDADIQKVTADTEDFIQRFKNEMSESDLNRLKEFDDLAKQAESAKPGFIQAALCVIRNLK